MNKRGNLFVVSGPSGVGKDTIVKKYLENNEGHLSVSATTRKPREGEVNEVDYYFLSTEEFEKWISEDNFLEYATYNNCYYGTPKSKIEEQLDKGIDVFLVIEVQGGIQIKEKFKDSILIFILPPSLEELKERLLKRNLDSEEMIENRLKIAEQEIEVSAKYDFMLVNRNVDSAVEKFSMIVKAQKN